MTTDPSDLIPDKPSRRRTPKPPRKIGVYGRSEFRVGEPLPPILFVADFAAILDVSLQRGYQLEHANELIAFELKPRIGNRRRYSGKRVQQWADGDGDASRFFASTRHRA